MFLHGMRRAVFPFICWHVRRDEEPVGEVAYAPPCKLNNYFMILTT